MRKTWLGATLLLAVLGLSQSPTKKPAVQPPSFQKLTADSVSVLERRVKTLEEQVLVLNTEVNHDIPILNDRTLDLNERLKHFEAQEGPGRSNKAMLQLAAELNAVDARVAQLERPEVEDEAK